MVKNSGAFFYYTVGGRVRFGESAREAVLREALEETKIRLEINRLAYIHENFFTMESNNEIYHEVCLYFLMKSDNRLRKMKNGSFKEEYGDVTFHWLLINNLNNYRLYPEFFKTELIKPTNETRYFITRDDETVML